MFLFDEQQLQSIEAAIRNRFSAYLYEWVSPDLVTPDVIKHLTTIGMLPETAHRLPEMAYKTGILLEMLGFDKVKNMSLAEVEHRIALETVRFDPIQTYSVMYAATRSGEAIRGLGTELVYGMSSSLRLADRMLYEQQLDENWKEASSAADIAELRRILAEGLRTERQTGEIVRDLGRALSEGFERNLDRIVRTELHNAMENGQADFIDKTKGRDASVYKLPAAMACVDCKRLFLHSDGSPRIFKLSDLRASSNWWKKRKDWKATLEAVHPHCRCLLASLPQGYVPLSDGTLIKREEAPRGQMNLNDL